MFNIKTNRIMSRYIQETPPVPITRDVMLAELERLRQQLEEQYRRAQQAQSEIDRQRMLEELERQRIDYEERIARLSGENEGLRREWLRSMRDLEESFRKEREAQNKANEKSIKDVKKSIDKLDKKLSGQVAKLGTTVNSLGKSVKSIFEKFEKEDRRSSEIAAEVRRLLKEAMADAPVERYTPRALEKIVSDIDAVAKSKLPAASNIAVCHQITRDIAHMVEEANRSRLKHEALLAAVRPAASALTGLHEANKEVEVDTGKGKKVKHSTDFWTKGGYDKIGKKVAGIARQLEADKDDKGAFLTDDDVVRLGGELEGLQKEVTGAVAETVSKVNESQACFRMVWNIVNHFRKEGWVVKKENGEDAFDFLGGEDLEKDMREGSFAILKKELTGEVLTLTVVEKDGKAQIVFQNSLENGNPATRAQIDANGAKIVGILENAGYPVGAASGSGKTSCVSDTPLPAMSSAKDLMGKGGSGKLREGIGNRK